jgi:hypothetical protein
MANLEYSCYYYHSNSTPASIVYVKKNNNIYIRITHFADDFEEEISYNYKEFIITLEDLKTFSILYECYLLSLLLTDDITKMKIDEYGNHYIDSYVCWKGMRFAKKCGLNYASYDMSKDLNEIINWKRYNINKLKNYYEKNLINNTRFTGGFELYITQKEDKSDEKDPIYMIKKEVKKEKTKEELEELYEKYK